ncbi:MAG: FecR domain-containing protein [Bryobacteraceae bacterium]|nr:FecR domain-containing protein [Bryobacteraceae bacterium]
MIRPLAITLAILSLPGAFAQQVLSVRSGLIHHVEGKVLLDERPLKIETGKFPMVEIGKTLATAADSRAELLLTPGAFLRLADNSSVKMHASSLSNAIVELVSGAALVEVAELSKEHRVAVKVGDSETSLLKAGLYMFDATRGAVRVFDGKAQMRMSGAMLTLTRGREARLGPEIIAAKFDRKKTDGLYQWSLVRSNMLATANLSVAGDLRSSGYRGYSGGWAWCPALGLMTFLPYNGYIRSPFGFGYYSPGGLWRYYADQDARRQASSGGGYGGNGDSSWGGWNGGGGGYRGSGVDRSSSSSSGAVFSDSGGAARASAPAAAPAQSSPGGARSR